jgi:hypothetical protein
MQGSWIQELKKLNLWVTIMNPRVFISTGQSNARSALNGMCILTKTELYSLMKCQLREWKMYSPIWTLSSHKTAPTTQEYPSIKPPRILNPKVSIMQAKICQQHLVLVQKPQKLHLTHLYLLHTKELSDKTLSQASPQSMKCNMVMESATTSPPHVALLAPLQMPH